VISLGLFLGSLFDKSSGAANLGSIVSTVLGFFSGAFIAGIGKLWEFDLLGQKMQFNDLFPTKWGTEALTKILTDNRNLGDITKELTILGVSGVITLALAIWFYADRHLKARVG
jgi:hypothetical protein